ncbi:unnamed protein product [Peronospora belbahrii]|uniref:CCT domain-containing protein n=1 Tax=Peronospora belbahrii TaxID=622444 RepID=A0AAU9L4M1_9STRA|nr:unnamed protein product [Peronospora belbahrii]
MMNPLSPMEENKMSMCLSPQEKIKSASSQRNKRSHAVAGTLVSASDSKKARLDDMFTKEFERDLDGWISDDYLRAMDFDDSLSQDIDWVAHDEMDLALSMDALVQDNPTNDEVNDFGFSPSSFLRGSFAFEDSAEMASTFVDPVYIRLNSSKDAEKLLMSFDTMKFKIPSPTSTSSKKRKSVFMEKNTEVNQGEDKSVLATSTADAGAFVSSFQSTTSAAVEELRVEPARVSATSRFGSLLSVSAPVDSLPSVLKVEAPTTSSSSKKIGSYSPAARKLRLQKFHKKRKNRTWKRSIKYDCRKKLADDRPRIKGRFVRVLENAGDTKNEVAPSPSNSVSTGYASSTGAMAAHSVKAEVAVSCLSTMASTAKQTASVTKSTAPLATPATSSATLPFARMIASV